MSNEAQPDLVGSVVDSRYKVIELLGTGGMGAVYRAEHVHIKREVALKLLHPMMGQFAQIGERFEREAVAVGRLKQDNCVSIQDFGQLDSGSFYLVMELVDGSPLDELFGPGEPMRWERALRIVRHVLAGLAHAHDAGIVHRDIKPENIIVTNRDGDPDFAKILDFGIAKLIGPAESVSGGKELTEAGTAFGTPTYMAPEQAIGDPVDGRTDLYAVSVLFYEMLTGEPPFKADDKLGTLAMHISKPVPALPPGAAPRGLERALRKGLAKQRADRFADAREYMAALDTCEASTRPVTPLPFEVQETIKKRERVLLPLAIVGALAIVVGISVALSGSGGSPPPTPVMTPTGAWVVAEDFLREYGGGDTSREKLIELASRDKRMEVRTRARSLADQLGYGAKVDRRVSLELDLKQGKTCEEREQAVVALRKLGDKKAIKALKKARRRSTGSRFDKKKPNACLIDEADEAIQYLESLP